MLGPVTTVMFSAVAFAFGGASIAPPSAPGPWRQLGSTVTSRPDKLAHFYRQAVQPAALAVVAASSSSKPIRLTWFAYCEEQSDDGMSDGRDLRLLDDRAARQRVGSRRCCVA